MDREGEAAESSADPLLQRLQDKYTKQRSEQLAGKRKRLEKELNTQAVRNNALPPSVELLSDETIHAFNELEAELGANASTRNALAQLHRIRSSVNQELRQSLAYLEDGYTSGFRTLLSEAQLTRRQREMSATAALSSSVVPSLDTAPPQTHQKATSDAGPSERRKNAIIEACPLEWRASAKKEVATEKLYQEARKAEKLPRRFTLKESLSTVTSLFAESLATLLSCEVVRIYLYDENGSLHCCACFPSSAATVGDPMRATYTEIMLAKELHQSVCARGIAVNGSEAQYNMLSKRDVDLIKEEVKASGWGSMRSCLIFPILFHKGLGRACDTVKGSDSAGMIHAVNKMDIAPQQAGQFTADDEVLLSMSSRLLGCMLSRYPMNLFTLRMDQALREAAHPNEGPLDAAAHLPSVPPDIVKDASLVGMKAMLSPQPIMILRAPISDIYQSRTHRSRNRKLGNLVTNDSALSTVDFNLAALNEIWESGMEDNVLMHKQYRILNEQMTGARLLMRNLLDGLAAARVMQEPDDIARYLQRLELFARSENNELLSEFISETLLAHTAQSDRRSKLHEHMTSFATQTAISSPEATATVAGDGERRPDPCASGVKIPLGRPSTQTEMATVMTSHTNETSVAAAASVAFPEADLFLDGAAARALLFDLNRLNAKVASRIHVDGPDGIRAYSSDPASKREQLQYITEVQERRVAARRQQLQAEEPPSLGRGTLHSRPSGVTLPPAKPNASEKFALPLSGHDSAKRPYRV